MAGGDKQKGGKKGRKIGRGKRRALTKGYKELSLKKRRILALMERFPKYRAPGWEKTAGYGLIDKRTRRHKSKA